jgi:hypothetical protein
MFTLKKRGRRWIGNKLSRALRLARYHTTRPAPAPSEFADLVKKGPSYYIGPARVSTSARLYGFHFNIFLLPIHSFPFMARGRHCVTHSHHNNLINQLEIGGWICQFHLISSLYFSFIFLGGFDFPVIQWNRPPLQDAIWTLLPLRRKHALISGCIIRTWALAGIANVLLLLVCQ